MMHIGFAKEARSLARDFMAGVDPTGIKTYEYGGDDQRRGRSRAGRSTAAAVGIAGGLAGGAVGIPSFTMGAVRGLQGIRSAKGGLKSRVAGGLSGFARGFKEPISRAFDANRVSLAIKRYSRGGAALSRGETGSARRVLRKVNLDQVSQVKGSFSGLGARHGRGARRVIPGGEISRGIAAKISPVVTAARRDVNSALGAGALLGGGGAALQYQRGAVGEREIKRRILANKRTK